MSKVNKILLALVIVLIIAFGVVLYWQNGGFETPYYAVYMSTGDLYFGKLSHFPNLSLTDVWLLQRSGDANSQNQLGVSRFDKAFWGPEDQLNLDSKNVVWTTKLKPDSQLAQFFKNPQLIQSQPQQQQIPQRPAVNSTSTKK